MTRLTRTTIITAVIAALLAGLGLAFLIRRKKHDNLRGQSRTVETALGTVEYGSIGKGAPILVLHGAGGGFDQGLHMTADLADHGYRLIAPSRFGYLRSSAPKDASPSKQAEAYAALLDKLGVKETVVLAISAGAWSGLHFALRYPARCKALVLLVPATKLPAGVQMYGGLMARLLFRSNLIGGFILRFAAAFPRLAASLLGTPSALLEHISAEEKQRIRQILYDGLPVRDQAKGMRLDLDAAHPQSGFPMRGIISPVLTISAADDGFGTAARAKEIADSVRDGTSLILPSGGHLLVERTDDVVREVVNFLKR